MDALYTRKWALRAPIIVAVLAASALLAPRASLIYVALLLGVGAAVVLVRQPMLGYVALVFGALLVPFAIGTGTETTINVAVLLSAGLIALWVLETVFLRGLRFLPEPCIRPLLALVLVAGVAFLAGLQPWIVLAHTAPLRAQIGGLALFVLSAGVFLAVGHQIREVRWLRRLVWLFLSLGALYYVGFIVPGLTRFTTGLFQRGADGSLFWTWLVALAFSQAAFNLRLHRLWRLALLALTLVILFVGFTQRFNWHSGWLPPLVAAVVILCVGAPRLGIPVALAGGFLVLLNWSSVYAFMMTESTAWDIVTRFAAWQTLVEIIKVSPVVGLGPANYYFYTPLFPIMGYTVHFNSHNNYVDLVAETGLLGLACFIWFVVEIGKLGWHLHGRVSPGFERAYVYGALGGLAGMMVSMALGDWVLPFVYNIGFTGFRASVFGWVFLGGLVALAQTIRNRAVTERVEIAVEALGHGQ